jgi:signal transduction histidine kinase/CheY-like chemotaxis protein
MPSRIQRKHPLLTRITVYVFAFATLISILTSGLQLFLTYQAEKGHIIERLDNIRETHLHTLINNVWSLDQQAIKIQLRDIAETPDIAYVKLQSGEEKPYIFGTPQKDCPSFLQRTFNLEKKIKDKRFLLGTVTIQATTANIEDRLLLNSAMTLAAEILTIFFASLFILFLFLLLYNRHINHIVAFTEKLEIGQLDQPLTLRRGRKKGSKGDELDRIVNALNAMQERLKKGIAAQRQAELDLFREKLFSDAVISSLPGILFVINERLQVVQSNHLFRAKLEAGGDYPSFSSFLNHIAEDYRQRVAENIEALFKDQPSASFEVLLLGNKGDTAPYLLSIQKLALDHEIYLIAIGTDLSERKKIEDQLRQAQKMEAIGTLAGGVAHDFNNILSAIFGYTDLARLEAIGNEKLRDHLAGIIKAAQRARELVSQILAFSRKTRSEKHPLELSPIVKETLKLLRSTLPSTIDIQQQINSAHTIFADPTEIHQVVMNLCTNAYHAMEGTGGILTVSLQERVISSPVNLSGTTINPGIYVQLTIEDTGIGMSDTTRQKIFEPYFTTKDPGTGTGLGLAVVHGIVNGHNGYITVSSTPGQGTAFHVFFPVVAQVSPSHTEEEPPLPQLQGGNETIMLVDDEEDILKYYSELLGRFSYQVVTYSSSSEALEAFRKDPAAFDLVITDQTMPDMTGDRLGREMLGIRADLPIIACSGFSRLLTKKEFLAAGFKDYFQKPVETEQFLHRIREILDGH